MQVARRTYELYEQRGRRVLGLGGSIYKCRSSRSTLPSRGAAFCSFHSADDVAAATCHPIAVALHGYAPVAVLSIYARRRYRNHVGCQTHALSRRLEPHHE